MLGSVLAHLTAAISFFGSDQTSRSGRVRRGSIDYGNYRQLVTTELA